MKLPKLFVRKKKKLRATTSARRSLAPEMEFEEMSEPNMKLSRALLIVLVLHVVAVAGIIAFNTIKSRQGAFPPPTTVANSSKASASSTNPNSSEQPAPALVANDVSPTRSGDAKIAARSATKLPGDLPEPTNIPKALPAGKETGNFYIVAKGDNPVKIAKKLKVSESDLLTVNHIDDPRKLQIGQKLIVPASKTKSKK